MADLALLRELKEEIHASTPPTGIPVRLVAIDGHGGAGKSTWAEELSQELNAEVIHTDEFASWDNSLEWWPRLMNDVLEPIRLGATALSYARASWAEGHTPSPVVDQPVTDIMLLEGVSSARREFRPYLSYAIWVETPTELCLQRGLVRDGAEMRDAWDDWFTEEDKYIERDRPLDVMKERVLRSP